MSAEIRTGKKEDRKERQRQMEPSGARDRMSGKKKSMCERERE